MRMKDKEWKRKKKNGKEDKETDVQNCAFILALAAVWVALENSDILGGSSCFCAAEFASRNSARFRWHFSVTESNKKNKQKNKREFAVSLESASYDDFPLCRGSWADLPGMASLALHMIPQWDLKPIWVWVPEPPPARLWDRQDTFYPGCCSALCLHAAHPAQELSLLMNAGMSAGFLSPYLCTGMDCFCQIEC